MENAFNLLCEYPSICLFWNHKTTLLLTNFQVLTDRFAKTSSSSTAACNNLSSYCGGTWKGMEQKLDYIQGLGFDAIWITPIVTSKSLPPCSLIAIPHWR